MPYKRSDDEMKVIDQPACVYLRSKAMYVTGELDPTHADEIDSHSHCWCNLTQHGVGPDEKRVERAACIAGRKCYVAR